MAVYPSITVYSDAVALQSMPVFACRPIDMSLVLGPASILLRLKLFPCSFMQPSSSSSHQISPTALLVMFAKVSDYPSPAARIGLYCTEA